MNVNITKMSSRGQVVIPQKIRRDLGLKEGTPLIVAEKGKNVVLQKISIPKTNTFGEMVGKAKIFAKNRKIKPIDIKKAIRRARVKI
ncbi:MAG: AbrB/MazE/SpoVT family DNA-binding domain-containing protein [Candidatus Altiarchaeota archaeon]